MNKQCKIEFYFRRKDIEKLLADNKKAEAIIIKQEIKPRKIAGSDGFINVAAISAYALSPASKPGSLAGPDETEIDGCPYPPGCPTETDDN